jgi:hypothetical protein
MISGGGENLQVQARSVFKPMKSIYDVAALMNLIY